MKRGQGGMGDQVPAFISRQVESTSYYFLTSRKGAGGGLAVVCGGRERCRADYRIDRASFPYHSIEFVVDGQGTVVLGGRRYPLGPGMAFAYGPGVPHAIRSAPRAPMTKYFVDFEGRAARAFFRRLSCARRPVLVADPSGIIGVLDELERSARTDGAEAAAVCALLLRVLGLRLAGRGARAETRTGRALEAYRRCRTLIDERHVELRTLKELAAAAHLAPAYVCRLFQRYGETTAVRHLLRCRMAHAAELLRNSNLLVKDVADRLGYSDAFHFSRAFKRVFGLPPNRYVAISRRLDDRPSQRRAN
ncbi:MAG TPA: AraC family transcriptional regulator [Kiritimatiellia bacterium]|nr:AraC family transcriptional regulator [Kiritimatiellia bacterium]